MSTSILSLILMAIVSALPLGPSLYILYKEAGQKRQMPVRELFVYLFADFLLIGLAWYLYQLLAVSKTILFWCHIAAGLFLIGISLRFFYQAFMQKESADEQTLTSYKALFLSALNPAVFLFYTGLLLNLDAQAGLNLFWIYLGVFVIALVLFLQLLIVYGQRWLKFMLSMDRGAGLLFFIVGIHMIYQTLGSV